MTNEWTTDSIPDLTGKIAIVTGASRGIGFATARALASKKATVILACRDQHRADAAVEQIRQDLPQAKVEHLLLDLTDLALVHRAADEFIRRYRRLDILINNAGIMMSPFAKTVDGFELQFATNHLGHFALTGFLLDCILCTPGARVVTMSSWGHHFGIIDFDNLNGEKGYDPGKAYSQSKLANLLFTYELQKRFECAGVDNMAAAAHPGWTATDLPVHWPMVRLLNPLIGQSPMMGALPALYAATAPETQGGRYYGPNAWGGLRGCPKKVQSSARSHDPVVAARLWSVSEELTGVRYAFPPFPQASQH